MFEVVIIQNNEAITIATCETREEANAVAAREACDMANEGHCELWSTSVVRRGGAIISDARHTVISGCGSWAIDITVRAI